MPALQPRPLFTKNLLNIKQSLDSPDGEVFSTPPSTPSMSSASSSQSEWDVPSSQQGRLTKRTSHPAPLCLDSDRSHKDGYPDLILDDSSPDAVKISYSSAVAITVSEVPPEVPLAEERNSDASPAMAKRDNKASSSEITPQQRTQPPQDSNILDSIDSRLNGLSHSNGALSPSETDPRQTLHPTQGMKSPCMVHSHLDKGYGYPWQSPNTNGSCDIARSLSATREFYSRDDFGNSSPSDFDFDEDDESGNLTRQLAETAASVREMSKQLGRARVRSNIQTVLIITKARDNRLIQLTRDLAIHLMKKKRSGGNGRGLTVYVDNQLHRSKRFDAAGIERDYPEFFVPSPRRRSSSSNSLSSMSSQSTNSSELIKEEGQLRYWKAEMCSRSPHLFDFVVTLGGDGTVLFASWLFQRIVPPVLPFALGSLGFLTNFDFADYQGVLDSAIDSGIRVNLRMRFTCTVFRAVAPEHGKGQRAVKKGETGEILMRNVEKGGWEALEGGWVGDKAERGGHCSKDKEIMCFTTRPVESFEVLNDLVVDRGPSPYVSMLELFGDEHHMTTVQADGLTVSTPTGSTAYSLSAGGSLVHPEIPSILVTPICPHTLSFRPIILPDSMELRICVPFNSRSTAWASFDGRGRVELKQGDHIKVTASRYPFPTVCADKQSTDWFHAISRTLKWNEREKQKSFVVVEEGPAKAGKPRRQRQEVKTPDAVDEVDDEEDEVSDEGEDQEDEEDEKFDIDGSADVGTAECVAKEKAEEEVSHRKAADKAREAGMALYRGTPALSRVSSGIGSGMTSGITTPDRFAGPRPHPRRVSPRHVSFAKAGEDMSGAESTSSLKLHDAEKGVRDDIRTPNMMTSAFGGKSRIPKDRDVEAESMKTPTMPEAWKRSRATHSHNGVEGRPRHHHRRSNSHDGVRRAFAKWGHDSSDSNNSDNDWE